MRRKFWIVISILSALISGMFLYEGGKLLFWFQDRRGGFVVLMAGIAVFILFVRGVWRGFPSQESGGPDAERYGGMSAAAEDPHGGMDAPGNTVYDEMAAAEAKESGLISFIISDLALGCGAAGVVLYLTRFWPLLLNLTAAGVVLGAAFLAAVAAALIRS
ncbi:MAG: hypothetical protein ACLROY_08845 [Mediterraneibacter sp.]